MFLFLMEFYLAFEHEREAAHGKLSDLLGRRESVNLAAMREVGEVVLKDGDEREIKAFRIDFASGHKIMALSSRPSNLRSLRVVKGVARVPDARGADATSSAGGKRHGDAAIALAMLVHAREKLGSVEAWECVTVGRGGAIAWGGW